MWLPMYPAPPVTSTVRSVIVSRVARGDRASEQSARCAGHARPRPATPAATPGHVRPRFCQALRVEALPKTRYAEERRDPPRVSGARRGRARHRRDRELGPSRRGVLGVPEIARQRRRLASIGRLIILDRRGTGLSDPLALDRSARSGDPGGRRDRGDGRRRLRARRDHRLHRRRRARAPPRRAYPERCRRSCSGTRAARLIQGIDYPWGTPEACCSISWNGNRPTGPGATPGYLRMLVPSRADDEQFMQQLAGLGRSARLTRCCRALLPPDRARRPPRPPARGRSADARAATDRRTVVSAKWDATLPTTSRTHATWRSTALITSGSPNAATRCRRDRGVPHRCAHGG